MINILTKDSLRRSVESASNGSITVIYDDYGYPNHMAVIPAFVWGDVDCSPDGAWLGPDSTNVISLRHQVNSTHPAFLTPSHAYKSEIFVGMYESSLIGTGSSARPVSLPNQVPCTSLSFSQSKTACASKRGSDTSGWHMMTNWEWSAVALWTWKNWGEPYGNNRWGNYVETSNLVQVGTGGARVDGVLAGTPTGNALTLTGSGPAMWRTNEAYNGISDFFGNGSEYVDLVKIDSSSGSLMMAMTNDYTSAESSWTNLGIYFDISGTPGSYTLAGMTDNAAALRTDTTSDIAIASLLNINNDYTSANLINPEYYISGNTPTPNLNRIYAMKAMLDPSLLTGGYKTGVNLYRNCLAAGDNPRGVYSIANPSGTDMYFSRGANFNFDVNSGMWSLTTIAGNNVDPAGTNTFRLVYS